MIYYVTAYSPSQELTSKTIPNLFQLNTENLFYICHILGQFVALLCLHVRFLRENILKIVLSLGIGTAWDN
jgi:hypothetical protein